MKQKLLFLVFAVFALLSLKAQVTQINSNKSLVFTALLDNNKAIYVSGIDETLWATDGTLAGTIQLSTDIKLVGGLGSTSFLNGKFIFAGWTAATGNELYITDGTPLGTVLVKDIYPNMDDSNPGVFDSNPGGSGPLQIDVALLNGYLYFGATRPGEGRELWRTDGTSNGTTLVKDIVTGPPGSNSGDYRLFSTGTYLLFAANNPLSGTELWRSDGTDGGTFMLKDINTGNGGVESSNPRLFYLLNNTVLFAAKDETHGEEIWRTDGSAGGTFQLMDINQGMESSTTIPIQGFDYPVFLSFHTFNNIAYFIAYNGTSTGAVWSTDGTTGNTFLLKEIVSGTGISFVGILNSINLPGRFIFPVSDLAGRIELWESNGTKAGTTLFKAFTPIDVDDVPFILMPFSNLGTSNPPLFQGDKFFFVVGTATEGHELWISDGTLAHTQIVENINPGDADGIDIAYSDYIYTTGALYFSANNGVNGVELWKSDGTAAGTDMVADIITGNNGSFPNVDFFIVNGRILFGANNGDNVLVDLYAVNGTFTPLPVKLGDFTVSPKQADAILNWRTMQEQNSKNFIVQRSFDGVNFQAIGTINASGLAPLGQSYSFTDAGIMNAGKNIVYYRLLATDIDGKKAYSQVIVLRLNITRWEVRLVANPVSENLKLLLSGITQNVQLTIIDMNGKKLYTRAGTAVNGIVNLPVSNLPAGIYTLLAESNNERKTILFKK